MLRHPQGEFSGVRPTGEQVTFQIIEISRAGTDGKFAECWSSADLPGVLHRLAVLRPADRTIVKGESDGFIRLHA